MSMNEKPKWTTALGDAATRRAPAFTLIELLCVVATIAILAAIAVPNFLEAQVRSKVARSIDDMHALAAALEAYWIDHRAYPPNLTDWAVARPGAAEQPAGPPLVLLHRIELSENRWLCETSQSLMLRRAAPPKFAHEDYPLSYNGVALIRLTTPVPYLGLFPNDPFFPRGYLSQRGALNRPPRIFGPPDPTSRPSWDLADMRPFGYVNFTEIEPDGLSISAFGRTVTYVLTSNGPDIRPSFTDAANPFPAIYDPTNGITSLGDLVLPGSQ
jgi:prepilin-type N-terminal cleavage/methylation domain-containing protein